MQIRCTNCGADLPLEQDNDFISCDFCNAALFVDEASTISSLHLRLVIGESDLMTLLSLKLASQDMPPIHRLIQSKLSYHPFWRFETGGTKTLMLSAAPSPMVEMDEFYAPGDKPLPFNPSLVDAPVTTPDTHHHEAIQALRSARTEARQSNGSIAKETLSLVYLPLFQISYEVAEQHYQACIEGAWGTVFADEWPANIDRQKNIILGAIGGVMSISFLLEVILIPISIPLFLALSVTSAAVYFGGLYALEHLERKGTV